MIVATRTPDVGENNIDDDASEGFSTTDYDSFSAASTSCTGCSYISYNMKINGTQLSIQPIHGHTSDCLENVAASNVNVGSISVQNGTDVTFGNKTFFNAPVVIKQLVVEQHDDETKKNNEPVKPKIPWRARTRHYFFNHPCMVCSIFSALAMILATLILIGYFVDPLVDNDSTCENVPSNPTYYSCGYASPCTRCQSMFIDKEICQAYYEHSCGDLRCFCKPECRSSDCRA